MHATITNKSDQRVLLRFNSSRTHRLAPGESIENVEHQEIKGNAKIEQLVARRLIAVRTQRDQPANVVTRNESASGPAVE